MNVSSVIFDEEGNPLDPYVFTAKWYEEHPEALRYEIAWLQRRPPEDWIGQFDFPCKSRRGYFGEKF